MHGEDVGLVLSRQGGGKMCFGGKLEDGGEDASMNAYNEPSTKVVPDILTDTYWVRRPSRGGKTQCRCVKRVEQGLSAFVEWYPSFVFVVKM